MQGSCNFHRPWWRCLPLAAGLLLLWLSSGLGWVMDLLLGWWLWVSNGLCHGPPQTYLWPKPYGSCCSFIPKKLGDTGCILWEDVILNQWEGGVSSRTSASVNMVRGSMACLSSSMLSISWQGLPGSSSWAFSIQYCSALVYARVFWGCFMQ